MPRGRLPLPRRTRGRGRSANSPRRRTPPRAFPGAARPSDTTGRHGLGGRSKSSPGRRSRTAVKAASLILRRLRGCWRSWSRSVAHHAEAGRTARGTARRRPVRRSPGRSRGHLSRGCAVPRRLPGPSSDARLRRSAYEVRTSSLSRNADRTNRSTSTSLSTTSTERRPYRVGQPTPAVERAARQISTSFAASDRQRKETNPTRCRTTSTDTR